MTHDKPVPHYSIADAARQVERASQCPDPLGKELSDLRERIMRLEVENELLRSENERLASRQP